jgi:hypothetical protein
VLCLPKCSARTDFLALPFALSLSKGRHARSNVIMRWVLVTVYARASQWVSPSDVGSHVEGEDMLVRKG